MSSRFIPPFILFAAIALVFAACNEGDEQVEVTAVQPAATEDSLTDDAGPPDAAEDDASDDGAEPTPEDPGPDEGVTPPAARGAGTISIGEMVFEYQVTFCSIEDDGSVLATGPGETADGDPFFAEAHISRDGVTANASVVVGVDSAGAEGDAKWQGANVMDAVVSTDDGLSLSFTTSFVDLRALEPIEMQGTVDVSCR